VVTMNEMKELDCYIHGKYPERILYKRIRLDNLDQEKIWITMKSKNVQKPNVIDLGDRIAFAYGSMRPIFIMKSNGRLYGSMNDGLDNITAVRLLRELREYVEGFRRIQYHKTVQFIDSMVNHEIQKD
jgi:hypothetical protein